MTSAEVQEHMALFAKHNWHPPVELERMWLHAAELSVELRRQFEQKMDYEEALKIGASAALEKIRTPEIQQAIDYAERSKRWTEKATASQTKWVTLKSLQTLVNDGKNLPVKLRMYDDVRQRFDRAHEWYLPSSMPSLTEMYKLLKNSKARTGNNAEKCSEEDISRIVALAQSIRFTNPDVSHGLTGRSRSRRRP
jgi:hypothetical protein